MEAQNGSWTGVTSSARSRAWLAQLKLKRAIGRGEGRRRSGLASVEGVVGSWSLDKGRESG